MRPGGVLGGLRVPLIAVAVLTILLLAAPLVVLLATSVTGGAFLQFPPQGFSLRWYGEVLQDPGWTGPFWLSVGLSLAATVLAVVLGTAAALAADRMRPAAARALRTLMIAPIALPPIAYAVGLLGVDRGLGVLRGTPSVLIAGEAVLAVPFVFVLVSAQLSRLDPSLRAAAASLGAGWLRVVARVELPLLVPSIVGGAVFAFSTAFDEVVLALLLLPAGTETLPVTMLGAAQEVLSPALTAASTLVSVLAVIVLAVFWRVSRRGSARMVTT